MAMTINTNVASLNAQRNLTTSQSSLASSLQRLSSGLRVNSAKDDAAGLAIAERMNAQVRGMNVAIRNANDGISLAQTAEGAVGTMTNSVQRMRELAVQAANPTNGTEDLAALQSEWDELAAEIGRVISDTQFNGLSILAADAGALSFQVGANSGQTVDVTTTDLSGDATVTTDLTTAALATGASAAIDAADAALTTLNTERAGYGATMSRLDAVVSNLQVSVENQAAARGRIMDTDFAAETANLSRTQILQQAGTAMLAQANSLPQNVLSLLR